MNDMCRNKVQVSCVDDVKKWFSVEEEVGLSVYSVFGKRGG